MDGGGGDLRDELGEDGLNLFHDHGADGAAHRGEGHYYHGVVGVIREFFQICAVDEAEVDDANADFRIENFIERGADFFHHWIFFSEIVECFCHFWTISFGVVYALLEVGTEDRSRWFFSGSFFGRDFFYR